MSLWERVGMPTAMVGECLQYIDEMSLLVLPYENEVRNIDKTSDQYEMAVTCLCGIIATQYAASTYFHQTHKLEDWQTHYNNMISNYTGVISVLARYQNKFGRPRDRFSFEDCLRLKQDYLNLHCHSCHCSEFLAQKTRSEEQLESDNESEEDSDSEGEEDSDEYVFGDESFDDLNDIIEVIGYYPVDV